MRRRFARADGLYKPGGRWHWPGVAEHLWPFARAFVATLDLAGLPAELTPGFDADAAIARHRRALERYWDRGGPHPAYASDPPGTPFGGDRYYDDNAWVGLALIGLERIRPGSETFGRARELFQFAASGWDERADAPAPGGVFWIEQGRGTGRRNHDRNTVSNAPNAELGLHLAELTGEPSPGAVGPDDMIDWVHATLRSENGLYWDKIRGDGSVDRALWSYNQGNMIGARVLQHRRRASGALMAAETIGRAALDHYRGRYFEQPAAFHAIFFRNLLILHAATADARLRSAIIAALREYADQSWGRRDRDDLFRPAQGSVSLLDQSALVQVLALLAWDPGRYHHLA